MPGHKRNMAGFPMEAFYEIDITEIDGFDNLHCPQGILLDIMKRAQQLFGAESYMLVNGSTAGILSAVSAVVRRGDRILMARNCHKSAFHGVMQSGGHAAYLYPDYLEGYGLCGSVSPREVERGLREYPETRAVFLTSPTYDGIVSDVAAIASLVHEKGIPLIVDEAHGAHFALDRRFPDSAVSLGADIVIHSIHKTLPALTQTALLHVQGELVDRRRLRHFLSVYQTSSPSYILMAGIEQCLSLLEERGAALCERFFRWNEAFERQMEKLVSLHILSTEMGNNQSREIFAHDTGKKVISTAGTAMTGKQLYDLLLHRYGLQMEMAGQDYVTAIMAIMDTEDGFMRLGKALTEIDSQLKAGTLREKGKKSAGRYRPRTEGGRAAVGSGKAADRPVWMNGGKAAYDMHVAMEHEWEEIPVSESPGRIAAGFIHIYPPGIPLIVPGEVFTEETAETLLSCQEQGFMTEGMQENNKVCVIGEEKDA